MRLPPHPEENLRPLAPGYRRPPVADPPEVTVALTAELRAHANKEGLTLADVFTDLLDPPTGGSERAGFCTLMDALRRHDIHAVIIPTREHLSRRPASYTARRTIIETEAGATLLVIHADRLPSTWSPVGAENGRGQRSAKVRKRVLDEPPAQVVTLRLCPAAERATLLAPCDGRPLCS